MPVLQSVNYTPKPALLLDEVSDLGDALALAQIGHHERPLRPASSLASRSITSSEAPT